MSDSKRRAVHLRLVDFARASERKSAPLEKTTAQVAVQASLFSDASTVTLGFVLAPRINAVGRMDDATKALELLLTKDDARASAIVAEMERFNSDRKAEQDRIMREALEQIQAKDLDSTPVLVLAAEGWNTGVVGIAAGRICEQFARPTILLSRDDTGGICSGSARSTEWFDILDALQHCHDLLHRYGGHCAAAGVSVGLANLEAFERAINDYAAEVITPEELVAKVMVDAELGATDISRDLANAVATMEPFGMGNPEPVFISRGMKVLDRQRVGDGSHLRLRVAGNGNGALSCIGFGLGELEPSLELGSSVDICYAIRLNTFNGVESVQLVVKAIR